jgi:hypothetical protein
VTDVLAFAHFAGQRLPFRRLQGILAFAITGAFGCKDILDGYPASLADRFYSLLFQREARGRSRPEPAAHVLAGADAALASDPENDKRILSWLGVSNPDLPDFECKLLRTLDSGIDIENMRALRRFAAARRLDKNEPRWRKALRLLEAFALKNDGEPLLRLATAALNHLHGHPTIDDEALVSHQIEPAAFRDPARASLELDLGFRSDVALTRGPVLPRLVREWLESCPSDIRLVAWPRGKSRPERPAQLRLDARLLTLLLEIEEGYRFLPALGTYRRELARFHARLLSFAKPDSVGIVVRAGDHAWRVVAPIGDRLRFIGQA